MKLFTQQYSTTHQIRFCRIVPAIIGILIVCTAMIVSCKSDLTKIKAITNTELPPSLAAEGFEMLASDSAVIRIKLQAPQLIKHDNVREPYTEFPQGVKMEKYDSHMKVVSCITARYAKNFDSDNRWEVKNNVVAVNIQGDTLKTEFMVWDSKKQKIYTDQYVKIIKKDNQIFTGTGFESDMDFSSYQIKGLKGQMYVNVNK